MPATQAPSTRRSRFGRRLALTAAVIAGVTLLSGCNEVQQEASDAIKYPPPGQLVDVGGHRLHLHCIGTGSPTVVIDAGLGDWSVPWRTVQKGVAGTTRICTYDRAGMGYSEPGPRPRDVNAFTGELHTLLGRANISGPYVMVGHSLGGLTARVFAHRYPQSVAGVVLVDSMSPQLAKPSAKTTSAKGGEPDPPIFALLSAAARLGLIRALAGPLGLADGIPPEDVGAYVAKMVTQQYIQTVADESAGIAASLAQAGQVTTLNELPLTVLTRGRQLNPEWVAAQRNLLTLSSNSRQVTAQNSGHGIELGQPQAVIDEVVKLVGQVR